MGRLYFAFLCVFWKPKLFQKVPYVIEQRCLLATRFRARIVTVYAFFSAIWTLTQVMAPLETKTRMTQIGGAEKYTDRRAKSVQGRQKGRIRMRETQ